MNIFGAQKDVISHLTTDLFNKADAIASIIAILTMIGGLVEGAGFTRTFVLTIVAFAVVIYIRNQWRLQNLKFPPRDKREDRTYNVLDSYFNKKSIRILDFLDGSSQVLEEKIFEDCNVYGPCLFAMIDSNVIKNSMFMAGEKVEDSFCEIVLPRKIIGVVGIKNCTFNKCRFYGIGFVGDNALLQKLKSGIHNKEESQRGSGKEST